MSTSSGDVIGWLNSDDVYQPGALMTVAAYFTRHPDVDVLYGNANIIDINDDIVGRYYTEPWNANRLPRRPFLCQPAVFFRRRIVDRFGLLDRDLQYVMDYEYWLRLARGGAYFSYLPVTLASARSHPDTKTQRSRLTIHAELNTMLRRYVNTIPDAWILTQTHAILAEERHGDWHNPLEFVAAVAVVSWRLSIELNKSVSPGLALSTLRTLTAGAAKTALRLPVTPPTT
jgi:hypothetical protein